nr:hypothetical protein [Arenibaculum pallidiluteum]
MPRSFSGRLRWLRGRRGTRVRVPAAVLLMAGGVLGFLPILGFWMLPLGVLLLALDLPVLRPPIAALARWFEGRRERRRWTDA